MFLLENHTCENLRYLRILRAFDTASFLGSGLSGYAQK
jgi:hypothetical protein